MNTSVSALVRTEINAHLRVSGEEQVGQDIHGNQDIQQLAEQSDEEELVQNVTQVASALDEQDS